MFEQQILVVNVVLLLSLIVFAGYRRRLSFSKAAVVQAVSVAFGAVSLVLLLVNVQLAEMWGWTVVGSMEVFSISVSILVGCLGTVNFALQNHPLTARRSKKKTKVPAVAPAPPVVEKPASDELPGLVKIVEKLREKKGEHDAEDSKSVPVEENAATAS